MIDINLLRADKGGNPDLVRESQRKRGGDAKVLIVDQVLTLDDEWKKARFEADGLNKKINQIGKDIAPLAKAKLLDSPEALKLKKDKEDLVKLKLELTELADQKEKALHSKLRLIGNIVHESVVVSDDEKDNLVVEKWWPEGRTEAGEMDRRAQLIKDGKGVTGLFSHHEVLEKLAVMILFEVSANVAGHRGYFLTGPGVDLNLALMHYGLDFLEKRGYTKLWTPFFMKREVMAKTAQLEEFDEALYSVEGEAGDAKYLIATSEQPISAFHAGEWFSDASELPKKYAGSSTCFRKEAGAHGRDTWGIFRVHQFEKIEQFVITHPEKSWEMHDEMIKVAKEFYQSLGLPYHIISIVSGALNNAAAKSTIWKLGSHSKAHTKNSYRVPIALTINVASLRCMNDSTKQYVHALNCTLTATERTICCILENFQTETGVVVPEPLRNYMGGKEFLPFVTGTSKITAAVDALKV
ncbi:serine-tRNA ligase [Batrachochytrium salamandrivorans]|nr:serine-tRNA ligase [Batrachochytrium salamandrivorans]